MLIALAGLPGTGKSTLARRLATETGAVWLRIDTIEDTLARSTLAIRPAEDAGYLTAYALAADNLSVGRIVVADSVNPVAWSRRAWRDVAREAGVPHFAVEVVCSDPEEHRRRVEGRRATGGRGHPAWEDVTARHYEPFGEERLLVDTARLSAQEAAEHVAAHLRAIL